MDRRVIVLALMNAFGRGRGQLHDERAALSGASAFGVNAAAVLFHEAPVDRQAKSQAAD
jgi:hypothetical protein